MGTVKQSILTQKQFIIANQPHITQSNDNWVNFNTDMTAPLKDCKIHFNPVQEGSGDPSPENIRTIKEWSSIEVRQLNHYIPILPLTKQEIYYDRNNTYRLQYLGNGKFKVLDSMINTTVFNFDTVPITWTNNINMFLAISDIKTKIGAWNFSYSFRDSNDKNLVSGYLDYGKSTLALIVVMSNLEEMINRTSSKLRLVSDGIALPQGTEFVMALANSNDILNYNIDLSTFNVTLPIYGGYVDLVSSELVETWKTVDLGDFSYTVDKNLTGIDRYCHVFADYGGGAYRDAPDAISDIFRSGSMVQLNNEFATWAMGVLSPTNPKFYFYVPSGTYSSPSEFASAMSGRKISYLLAEPIHYPINPQTLKALRGTNNIWSNTDGPIEIKYWKH